MYKILNYNTTDSTIDVLADLLLPPCLKNTSVYLVRRIYTSSIARQFDENSVAEILQQAKKITNSSVQRVCRALVVTLFYNAWKGSRSAVNATYHRILNDPAVTKSCCWIIRKQPNVNSRNGA